MPPQPPHRPGLLYAVLAIGWWPTAIIGAAVAAAGWLRAYSAASVLADLIDTAADLHTSDLAAKLGIPATVPVTTVTGRAITCLLRPPATSLMRRVAIRCNALAFSGRNA